jgi:hypothetical protein
LIADRQADEAARERVDVELDVEVEAMPVEGDGDRPPVADPLRAPEESLEGAAQRPLVGGAWMVADDDLLACSAIDLGAK